MSVENTGGTFTMNESDDEGLSLFDELKAEAAKSTAREPELIAVTGRPGWAVEYTGDVSIRQLQMFVKRSRIKGTGTKGKDEEIDPVKLSVLMLTACQTQLVRVDPSTGEVLKRHTDEDGDPVGLTSEPFLKSFSADGSMDSMSAIVKFLGESGTNTHGGAVQTWLGLDDEAERLNPSNA